MTAAQFDLGLRLAAHHEQRLVRRTTTTRFDLRPDAMLVSVLASPGDHAGLWGLAWSTANGRANAAVSADPRPWSAQVALWEQAGKAWAPWLAQCTSQEQAAQFIVADQSAADRIVSSARKVASSDSVDPVARAAARAFIIAAHASRTTGQQSIAAMTQVLREHFVSGADPLDEGNLGLWTAWPALRPGWDDPQTGLPPGADDSSKPLGKAWDKMTRHSSREAASEMAAIFGQNVITLVRKIVIARWDTLKAATTAYRTHQGPLVSQATAQAAREGKNFTYLMSNERLPATRSARARWVTLADRELAAGTWQAALWTEDALERARGAASGDVLVGEGRGDRVLTEQLVLRVRPGDKLTNPDGYTVHVVDLLSVPHGLEVLIDGNLTGSVQAWPAGSSVRQPIPAAVPWTHDPEATPEPMHVPSGDLLAATRALATS